VLTFSSSDPPDCATESGTACAMVWKATGLTWLSESSDILIVTPLRILIIIAICLIARGLINRGIKRLTNTTANGRVPAILRPFKERVPNLMSDTDTTELLGDRRRQRAHTIGSVLRSLVTWLVYATMLMLVLAELNVNLGPLLASAGVAGLAIGFGAQALVKDVISGLFMIMEDQYGVGDSVDLGEAIGTVEVVGLRVTTLRDMHGTLWYVRNGEIIRVGNQSQSWANVVLDIPLSSSVDLDTAATAISAAAGEMAEDPTWSTLILEAPDAQGVVDINVDATVFRVIVKTTSADQWAVGRELRRRVSHALRASGISEAMSESRVYVRRSSQPGAAS
jgi:small-conductance mechanosensitive channel